MLSALASSLVLSFALSLAASPALADPPVVEISIDKYQFIPAEIQIKAGTTVRWINNEKRTSHSVLFPVDGALESERLLPGDSYERTFEKAGIYPYTCTPHPEMKGLIKVTG